MARRGQVIYGEGGELFGRVTSGGFGWRIGQSVALAMIKLGYQTTGTRLKTKILGNLYDATVVPDSPFDPDNLVLRA
jgi:dimethylglycine dehydrogenase